MSNYEISLVGKRKWSKWKQKYRVETREYLQSSISSIVEQMQNEGIIDWLEENINGVWHLRIKSEIIFRPTQTPIVQYRATGIFSFSRLTDAALFRLRF